MSELTNFDLIVIGVLLFTSIRAYFKGFIKEFLHAGNYILSFILAKPLSIFMKPLIASRTENQMIIDYLGFAGAFIIIVFTFAYIIHHFAPKLEEILTGSVNKFLGFTLGFLKGYLICATIFTVYYLVYQNAEPIDDRYGPQWMREAKLYPVLKFSTNILSPIILNSTDEETQEKLKNIDPAKIEEARELHKQIKELDGGKNKNTDTTQEKSKTRGINNDKTSRYSLIKKREANNEDGYTKEDIRGMNKLLNKVSKEVF